MKPLISIMILLQPINTVAIDSSYICAPLYEISLKETSGKPSDPKYLPLFYEAQRRMSDQTESVEDYCEIVYDCGNTFLVDGEIEFKDCTL